MTGAVLFQFSRYPQFLTTGYGVSIGSDIVFIYMQFFVNCATKLQKNGKTGIINRGDYTRRGTCDILIWII